MQSAVVVGLLAFQGILAAAIVADPMTLGIPPTAIAWAAILNVGVGILLNQLKALGGGTVALGTKAPNVD